MNNNFLKTDLPIIQAPMAGVQDHLLAIAVSNAGGLGSLPCGLMSCDEIHQEIRAIRTQTSKPFNINFFCHQPPKIDDQKGIKWQTILQPYFDEYNINSNDINANAQRIPFNHEMADIVVEYKPNFVSFHFGLPEKNLLSKVKATGAKILASATTIKEAKWLEAQGVDAIIAQGLEAGGHRGMFLTNDLTSQTGTFALLPQVVKAVNIPVIAAGGITDSKGVNAALSLGASAVQIGTAYLLCSETKTTNLHRKALKQNTNHTAITNIFSGRPARGIVNRIIKEIGPICKDAPDFPLASTALTALRKQAELNGCDDFSPLWCGQNVSGCKETSAAELTKSFIINI